MTAASGLMQVVATIPAGQSQSAPVSLALGTLVGITMPDGWTAAGLGFQASPDGATYSTLYDSDSGLAVFMPTAASEFMTVKPERWGAVNYLIVQSVSTDGSRTPVNQVAAAAITLMVRVGG